MLIDRPGLPALLSEYEIQSNLVYFITFTRKNRRRQNKISNQ